MADKAPPYEIPSEMRDFAEKSVDQARKAFDSFMSAAHKATAAVEDSSETVQAGARDIGRKAMGYAEQNVASALDFATRLVHAKDAQEIARLQAEFLKAQLDTFGAQAKDIGTATAGLASRVAKQSK